MNPRTLLPNQQLDKLIDAVSSNKKNEIPEQRQDSVYMGALHEIDRQARETIKLVNANPWPCEPQNDCVFAVHMAVVVLILIVVYELKGGKK